MGSSERMGALDPSAAEVGSSGRTGDDLGQPGSPGQRTEAVPGGSVGSSEGDPTSTAGGGATSPAGRVPTSAAGGSGPVAPLSGAHSAAARSTDAAPHDLNQFDSDLGWFTSSPGAGQYSGALSERLSAERPGEAHHRPPTEGGASSTAPSGSHLAGPEEGGPPGPQGPSSMERSGDAESPTAGGPAEVGESPGAEPPEPRGPVLASHAVDAASPGVRGSGGEPADSPLPRAVGSVPEPADAPSSGPSGPVGDEPAGPAGAEGPGVGGPGEPAGSPGPEAAHGGTGVAPIAHELRGPELIEAGMVYVDPDPEIGSPPKAAGWSGEPAARQASAEGRSERSDAEPQAEEVASESDPRQTSSTAGLAPDQKSPESGVASQPRGNDSGWTGMEADGGQGTDAEARPGSDPVGWNEPALPMALPPGMSPSDLGEQREPGHEEELDGELLPKPDPTWPRLFGSRAGAQAVAETDDVSSPPDQPAVPGRGTTGEQPVEASHEHASRERQGGLPEAQHGARSTDHGQVVDVTGEEPRIGGESTPQPGTGQQPTAVVASSASAGADDAGDSIISTVTRQAEAGQVDLRDTPTSPRSVDVSRETSAGGEGMEPGLEDETIEDEAAMAVREAVSRAAAEAGGDVSRETSPLTPGTLIDDLSEEPSIDREAAARTARVTFRIHRETLNGDRRSLPSPTRRVESASRQRP